MISRPIEYRVRPQYLMKKKQNRKRSTKQLSPAAAYKRGMDLYFEKSAPDSALKYLMKAGKAGYSKAYGEIGIILHREKNEAAEAEEWFIKAERSGSLFPAARYEYGMLHYLSKDDWETGLKYLLESANQGYELAYGDIGSIIYMYKENIDEAEEWFRKAEASDCLLAPMPMITEFCYGWAKITGKVVSNISRIS